MRYDQLRDVVAKRKPGWEYLQEVRKIFHLARYFFNQGNALEVGSRIFASKFLGISYSAL